MNTIKSKALAFKDKVLNKCKPALLAVATALATTTGYALPGENTSADQLVTAIINVVFYISRYVGVIFIVSGVYQLVMAYKDEGNPDGKSRGIHLSIVGIVLIGLKGILQTVGLI